MIAGDAVASQLRLCIVFTCRSPRPRDIHCPPLTLITGQFQDELSLAAVILYDYQDRRFQRRQPLASDRHQPRHCHLEEALFHLRTRLSAALARIRILHDAPTLQTLLPADVHPPEPARLRPVHAWLNGNKARWAPSLIYAGGMGRIRAASMQRRDN